MTLPPYHGATHLPGGPDPIRVTGFGEQYAYAAASGGTITPGGVRYWDLSGGAPSDPPVSDNQTLFTAGTIATGPGAGMGAVKVNGPGLLRITSVFQALAEESSGTIHARTSELLFQGPGSHFTAGFQTGSQNYMILGYQSWVQLVGVGADGYKLVGLQTTNNDVSGTASGNAYMYIAQLDERDWTTLPIPP